MLFERRGVQPSDPHFAPRCYKVELHSMAPPLEKKQNGIFKMDFTGKWTHCNTIIHDITISLKYLNNINTIQSVIDWIKSKKIKVKEAAKKNLNK